jgi:hypothetical protein
MQLVHILVLYYIKCEFLPIFRLWMGGLKWKRRGRAVLTLLFASVCVVMLISCIWWPSATDLIELEKCPACYGVSLCPAITGGLLTVDSFGSVAGLVNILGAKNVLFGMLGNQKVVLKKLGHAKELANLDRTICEEVSQGSSCHVNKAIWQHGDLMNSMRQHVSSQGGGLLLCPTVVNLEQLLSNVFYKNKDIGAKILHANIWTSIVVNPEPLLLQVDPYIHAPVS